MILSMEAAIQHVVKILGWTPTIQAFDACCATEGLEWKAGKLWTYRGWHKRTTHRDRSWKAALRLAGIEPVFRFGPKPRDAQPKPPTVAAPGRRLCLNDETCAYHELREEKAVAFASALALGHCREDGVGYPERPEDRYCRACHARMARLSGAIDGGRMLGIRVRG